MNALKLMLMKLRAFHLKWCSDRNGKLNQHSTAAVDVHDCILRALDSVGLNPGHMVVATFDGAASMSRKKGGVHVLLI